MNSRKYNYQSAGAVRKMQKKVQGKNKEKSMSGRKKNKVFVRVKRIQYHQWESKKISCKMKIPQASSFS